MIVELDNTIFTPVSNGNYGQDFKRSDFYNSSDKTKKVNFISGKPAENIEYDDNLVHSEMEEVMFPKQIERDLVWPATPEQRAKADQIYKNSYSKNTNQNLDVAIFDTPIQDQHILAINLDPNKEEFFTKIEQD